MSAPSLQEEADRLAEMELSYMGTGELIHHHRADQCEGQHCALHNPSGHHMTTWPLHFRADRPPLLERICAHGVGHPDPDSAAWLNQEAPQGAWSIHGCDGCCGRD